MVARAWSLYITAALCVGVQASSLDMLSGSTYRVSLDGTMGGRSDGVVATNQDGAITFSGNINTNGGGFANMHVVGGNSMDLSALVGLHFTFDTMTLAYGSAPVAFSLELESNKRCSVVAAFAVPTTAVAEIYQAWVPLSHFQAKGRYWEYRGGASGVPSSCIGDSTSMKAVSGFSLGPYFQHGPFSLKLRSVRALAVAPTPPGATESTSATDVLVHSTARASSLLSKAGSGVGMHQMASMAVALLKVAASQSANKELQSVVNSTLNKDVATRASMLLAAFEEFVEGQPGGPSALAAAKATIASASAGFWPGCGSLLVLIAINTCSVVAG